MNPTFLHRDEQLWLQLLATMPDEDRGLLERTTAALPLAADLTRSDVFLLALLGEDGFGVVIHARPHSMATLYPDSPVGHRYGSDERPWLWSAVRSEQRWARVEPEVPDQRPEMGQEVWPVVGTGRRSLAAMVVYTNVIERERHRRRDPSFQRALHRLLTTVAAGQLAGVEVVPPFEEQDGILFVDHQAHYRYLSGQANNVYRRLGYLDDLRGRSLDEVAAGDLELVQKAWQSQGCEFAEGVVRGHIVQRSAIPLFGPPDLTPWEWLKGRRPSNRYGALVIVKDVTEEIAQERELKVKAVMIKEVHHRVKNNLQMLVSIMRMQARRAFTDEARSLLYESINRILSMSAIHESLSEGEDQVLNLRDVAQRMMRHLQQSAVGPARDIRLLVEDADDVFLPTNKATACALVINELVLNALKHGFHEELGGRVAVVIHDRGQSVEIRVVDNGHGLPKEFSLESETSLGLDIIRTLVQDDLKGTFELISRPQSGAQAVVCFPKTSSGGPV
ncbi:MAG: PAS domain-containing sensor histidine kinase [Caldilineales bacterium]|nr:PAS domain-containing sensor histidine kinase [Caldilineales bacterium]